MTTTLPAIITSVGALDAVGQRLAAAVEVVELALGDRVVHVDRRDGQFAALVHLVQAMHAGGGFLGEAAEIGKQVAIFGRMDDGRQVAAVIDDQVQRLAIGEEKGLLDAPVVFGIGFAFPGIDGDARGGHCGGGVILRRVLVATAPGDFGAQLGKCFDKYRRLDGHVQAAGDPRAGERPSIGRIFAAAPSGRAFRARRGMISLRPNSACDRSATL